MKRAAYLTTKHVVVVQWISSGIHKWPMIDHYMPGGALVWMKYSNYPAEVLRRSEYLAGMRPPHFPVPAIRHD